MTFVSRVSSRVQNARRRLSSPEWKRLAGEIARTWVELDSELQKRSPSGFSEPWVRTTYTYLLQAEGHLAERDVQEGWVAVQAAQRTLISGLSDDKLRRVALILRREAAKLSGWRAKAIEDLLRDPKDEAGDSTDFVDRKTRIIDALTLRDDYFQTNYYKIFLRRRHLRSLCAPICLALLFSLALSAWGLLPAPLDHKERLSSVLLFGVLGASVSVAQSLLSADISAKIPEQQIGAFVVWMRPAIGATAALAAVALIFGGFINIRADNFNVLAVAFAAGFSERFLLGAVKSVTQDQ